MAGTAAGEYFSCTNSGIGEREFPLKSLLQFQQLVQAFGWKEQAEVHVIVFGTDAVDAPVSLDDAHGVPRKVVVDHLTRLLEVHPFSEDVCREEDVEFILRRRLAGSVARPGRLRGETRNGGGTSALINPGWLVEIEADAVVSR